MTVPRCPRCHAEIPEKGSDCPRCSPSALPAPPGSHEETASIESTFPSVPGYRIESLLGRGGMGEVFLARDQALNRRVALKIVTEQIAADPDSKKRFLREARVMASFSHPHVVQIFAFGELQDGRPYFAMEWVKGKSLSQRLASQGPLPLKIVFGIMEETVAALEAARKMDIIHRDIKPSNLLLTTEGRVKVADFGLAKSLKSDISLTQSGVILGSPRYLSPEQGQGKALDFRTDIYSLGIVFFEMLTGRPPFEGDTPVSIVIKHVTDPMPAVEASRKDLPAAVPDIVRRMTAKDPDDRYDSYAPLRRDLRQALNPQQPAAPALPEPVRSTRKWLVAALLLLIPFALWQASKLHSPKQTVTRAQAAEPVTGPKIISLENENSIPSLLETEAENTQSETAATEIAKAEAITPDPALYKKTEVHIQSRTPQTASPTTEKKEVPPAQAKSPTPPPVLAQTPNPVSAATVTAPPAKAAGQAAEPEPAFPPPAPKSYHYDFNNNEDYNAWTNSSGITQGTRGHMVVHNDHVLHKGPLGPNSTLQVEGYVEKLTMKGSFTILVGHDLSQGLKDSGYGVNLSLARTRPQKLKNLLWRNEFPFIISLVKFTEGRVTLLERTPINAKEKLNRFPFKLKLQITEGELILIFNNKNFVRTRISSSTEGVFGFASKDWKVFLDRVSATSQTP